ncbi:MAG: helix-turn-helix domain-containing protein [Meiothermus sp.]|nr:helix-turn-helix domain-containing protein [Meiothermus sp.]
MGDEVELEGLIQEAHRHLEELRGYLRTRKAPSSASDWPDLDEAHPSGTLELRLLGGALVTVGGFKLELRPRFVELLCVLALHPEGLTGEQLALAVWGEDSDPAVVKTELCRLRNWVPLDSRPYRLGVEIKADFLQVLMCLREGDLAGALQLYRGPLLPRSEAPEVLETRILLEESLRRAVLRSGNSDLIWHLAERLNSDLEVWEAAHRALPETDNRRPLAQTQVTLLKSRWQGDLSRAV